MKEKLYCLFFIVYLLMFISPVYADYVLPYPSYMPGNKLYTVSRTLDRIKAWWNFGSIASFRYHLELSDKYLVEAKTLFEYKQYLLAFDALKRSNEEMQQLDNYMQMAKSENKDTTQLQDKVKLAALKHEEVLEKLNLELPEKFEWTPEKTASSSLDIRAFLLESIAIRKAL